MVKPAAGTSIGIVSGRGGVGKTVLAVNLSAALTKHSDRNIIVDADVSNPSVSLHLGLPYSPIGLQEVLTGHKHYRDAVLVHPTTGIRVLPSSLKYERGTSLHNLPKVIRDVGQAYEFTIVDSPPGITDDVLQIMESCDEVIVVTTPDVPGVSSATKIISLCKGCGKRIRGVVVNRCTGAPYELTAREIETMTGAPVLVQIPEDRTVPESISVRTPDEYYSPNSPASRKIGEFALSFVEVGERRSPREGVVARLLAFLRGLFP